MYLQIDLSITKGLSLFGVIDVLFWY